jgi:hypothetical protein
MIVNKADPIWLVIISKKAFKDSILLGLEGEQ